MHFCLYFSEYIIYYTVMSLLLLMQFASCVTANDIVLLWPNRSRNHNRQIYPVLPYISLLTRSKTSFRLLSLYLPLLGSIMKPVDL